MIPGLPLAGLVILLLPERSLEDPSRSCLYTPFEEVLVRIVSPDSNQHRRQIDSIRVRVSSPWTHKEMVFRETGLSTGVFEKEIQLTPDPNKYPGDIRVLRDDGVTVSFRFDEDTVVTKSFCTRYHKGGASWGRSSYNLSDRATLEVRDPDANRLPHVLDILQTRVVSSTDPGGLRIALRETGPGTGIFQEQLAFTRDEASTGTRLRVSHGDELRLRYTDRTLPGPAALSSDGIETLSAEEVTALAHIQSEDGGAQ